MGGIRRALVRTIRYFVLRPVALLGALAGVLALVAVILLIPVLLPAVPAQLYWVIPDFGKEKSGYPAGVLTKKIELTSVLGHEVELKNAASTMREPAISRSHISSRCWSSLRSARSIGAS